jgi:RNA polymerase I-specific transcription initiation factor RRN7
MSSWKRTLAYRTYRVVAEVHAHAQQICTLVDLEFSFPTRKNHKEEYLEQQSPYPGYSLLDNPDVLLVASLVLAAKYLYPLDSVRRIPSPDEELLVSPLDWTKWQEVFTEEKQHTVENKPLDRLNFERMGPEQVWSMTEHEMDEYLAFYQETRVENKQGKSRAHGVSLLSWCANMAQTKMR